MYKISWLSDGEIETFTTKELWELRIEKIAKLTPYDINIEWERNTAVIDDGDPYDCYEEIEEYPDAY